MRAHSLWALAALAIASGCNKNSGGSGEPFAAFAELNPNAKIPVQANLQLADVTIPVEVKQTESAGKVTLALEAYGQIFESETYAVDDKSFSLVDAAGETYDKPLPLLQFPMKVGDTLKWSGTMTAGEAPHKAEATIASSTEQILIPGTGSTPSVLVVVDLSIESGAEKPATRKLRFWFVKDKGLVKRQFGIGSIREPKE